MPRKKVDGRVRTLIENAVDTRTRAFFIIVGDRGKDQVANLHYILTKAQVKAKPNVLWCYNKDLGFSTHRQKRMRQIKKLQQRGLYDPDKDDPFELFVSSTNVRWCYYKETHRILGNTFSICVLQDFEAITPNILCRAIETVEGGGLVILLLHTMTSLKQFYTLAMDVHERFRTEAHQDVVGRFNERFMLSLASCESSLVLDDELNVLPISRHAKNIVSLRGTAAMTDTFEASDALARPEDSELRDLKLSVAEAELVGPLTNLTRTVDQARAVLTFADAISEKTLRSTVALTAGRGRGKSAALGLAIAAAVGYGYANIFVTSPAPENLKTLFDFLFQGLESLAFREHLDYEAVSSTNPDFNKAVVRINIFRGHRQTVQYIEPHDAEQLSQAELVVVDEAAAIPLPLVKRLLGPYLVFLSSTVNGYEGTGRSLSLKLIQQLRQQQAQGGVTSGALPGSAGGISGRAFREVALATPIRYAAGDKIEAWLNDLLCLDATTPYRLGGRLPAPAECQLFAVNRDTLFSCHALSEAFLHRMMSLYVSSHYKNSPNDLQLMSDAPAHRMFVLLGPQKYTQDDPAEALPDILCVIQVCLEGRISRDNLRAALSRGVRSSGDLIPWTISQQFSDDSFAELSGARVVRIATHPDATKLGYGTWALGLLADYYGGRLAPQVGDAVGPDLKIDGGLAPAAEATDEDGVPRTLATEKVKPRKMKELPPLLISVRDVATPERLHWLGVSYGLTLDLFNFWRKAGYLPAYLRQTANDLTSEHTMIMLKPLDCSDVTDGPAPASGWHIGFVSDFARRYMQLLSFEFKAFDATSALSVMDAACSVLGSVADARALTKHITATELGFLFTPHDLKRLESYARNLVDYHMILDLLPDLTRLYFGRRIPDATLPTLQAAIILGMGLQRSSVEALSGHFNIQVNQVLALFNKAVRKLSGALSKIIEGAVAEELHLPPAAAASYASKQAATAEPSPPANARGDKLKTSSAASAAALVNDEELRRYTIPDDASWDSALKNVQNGIPNMVSVNKGTGRNAEGQSWSDGKRRKQEEVYDPRHRLHGDKKPKRARSAKDAA